MKAILIDPYTRSISTVESTGSLESITRLLQCKYIEKYPHNDTLDRCIMFVDEEGNFVNGQSYFYMRANRTAYRIAGRAVIFSEWFEEKHDDCPIGLVELQPKIIFNQRMAVVV